MSSSYVVISPVRNEAKYLPGAISSMAGQTIVPAQWVIVDDGSADNSPELLADAARKFPWITLLRRQDRGSRKPGGGVIEAFYDGYAAVSADWRFIVKLDGDVTFDPDYFELCLRKFAENPKLGIGGGTVGNFRDGKFVRESEIDPEFHVRGATKIYRRECWSQIGELIRAPGWDTLDELKANMLGWTTRTFPDVKILHHKLAGSADGSWTNWVKNGLANYIVGYHPLFMFAKAARRFFEPPLAVGAVGLLFGFMSGYVKRIPQVPDRELISYLRRQQIRRLTLQPSLWR